MTACQQASVYEGSKISLPPSLGGSSVHPGNPRAGTSLNVSGDVNNLVDTVPTDVGDWIFPKTGMSNYECYMQTITGSVDIGTVNSWLALSSTRTWECQRTTTGISQYHGTLKIRRIGTTTDLATSDVNIYAQYP